MDFNLNEDFSDFKENSPLITKMKEEVRYISKLFSEIEENLDVNERTLARENITAVQTRLGVLAMMSDLLEEDEQNEISEEEVEEYHSNFEEIINTSLNVVNQFPPDMDCFNPDDCDFENGGIPGMGPMFGSLPEEIISKLGEALKGILPPGVIPDGENLEGTTENQLEESDKKLNDDEIDF